MKEKEIRSTMKKISDQVQNQKSILMNKESKYNELVKKRTHLENAINKFGNIGTTNNSANNNINDSTNNFSALQYLYHSYILEMNNLENDFIRKQNSNDIISKDIKINRLLEQLKIRDEYISQEKKSLASKKIKFVFEQEKDIKKIEDLSIDAKNFSLPFIVQQDKRLITQNFKTMNNNNLNLMNSPSNNSSRNKVNLINNGQYDYSGYTNPNIIMEKKVIRTKTNEIMLKTKRNQISDLRLNILNDRYKNSKLIYINKGGNPNLSFNDEPNVIAFDSRRMNRSQSNSSFSHASQNESFDNSYMSSKVFNYKERKIDKKIKNIYVSKKKISPYVK